MAPYSRLTLHEIPKRSMDSLCGEGARGGQRQAATQLDNFSPSPRMSRTGQGSWQSSMAYYYYAMYIGMIVFCFFYAAVSFACRRWKI